MPLVTSTEMFKKAYNGDVYKRQITHHRHLVLRGCFRVGLYWQGLCHDLSKYLSLIHI